MQKAAATMAAPKPPSAPGAGSPTLSAKPPSKPPTAAAHANPPMGKALMPFSAQHEGAAATHQAMGGAKPTMASPKAQPKAPSSYDPSLYQPQAPVSSGLELAGPPSAPPGTGVTPRPAAPIKPRSPAMLKNVQGFHKAEEMCKTHGGLHKAGQCS